ncbi:MAG TPA: prolyl oligopeptidase family serine peptidase, partial [Rhodothermales bacterium]|nr:prolyl oligopeptidase family serine peptidase [Rhodothermales bacterium]
MRRLLPLLFIVLVALPAAAQTTYQAPPPELARLIDAPATPGVSLSPDGRTMLIIEQPGLPPIAEVSAPEARLAGLRINPATNGPSRAGGATGLKLRDLSGRERAVTGLPQNPRLRGIRWSPDSRRVAFTQDLADGIVLYVLDANTAQARRVGTFKLNEALGSGYAWLPSSDGFIARIIPASRPALPAGGAAPEGPVVQETAGRAAPAPTYEDLLASPTDEAAFTHYGTAQVVRVGLDGRTTPFGEPGLIARVDPSPDGRFVLVETVTRPFSYLVPLGRFPRTVDVLDARTGARVHRFAELPLRENVPVASGSVPTGPRSIDWRADAPATLVWVEALDGGDGRRQAAERDRVFMLPAPFHGSPITLATLPLRYGGVTWGNGQLALVSEQWTATRKTRTYKVSPDAPGAMEVLFDRSYEDAYGDPGSPMTVPTPQGTRVLRTEGGAVFLVGNGASPEGDRPFLRRMDLAVEQTTELFRSTGEVYERPVTFLPDGRLLITSETPNDPPQYVALDLRSNQRATLTAFAHPYPELRNMRKERITYRRADGVPLSAMLYLPQNYDARRDGPLPAFVWAYPAEYKSADAAGQVTGSPYRFDRISVQGALPFVLRGYAVLDNAAMPIVGEGDAEPNDTFVDQLRMNAEAVINEGVRRGVVDSSRVGVGGHSYGAFMTANLLAHTNLFRAGIARSGAYNRTLTPFGFQNEQRTYWEAPEVYDSMSPFQNAAKINEPILMIHGIADNNTGTYPIQS